LILLPPALVLSGFQEIGVRYPNLLVGALACVAECAASAVVIVIARILRRNVLRIPLPLCIFFWALVGVVHGLAAGVLAAAFAGAQPHYPARAAFWGVSALIWLPLATYAVSQFANRRTLLASLRTANAEVAATRRDAFWEIAELRTDIVSAIRDNIRPVLVDIASSIESIGPALEAERFAALGKRLADVSEETSRIIETTRRPATAPSVHAIPPSAPLTAALDFDGARPVMAALLTCVALLPVAVPVSFGAIDVHPEGLGSAALILAVVAVVLTVGLGSLRFVRRLTPRTRIGWTFATFLVAGFAAAASAVLGPWQPANEQNLILAVLLPIAVPLAAITLSSAVGLGNANLGIVSQVAAVESERAALDAEFELRRREIRGAMTTLTHGPLRGRLAACAMALNFHAAEIGSTTPERTAYITSTVLEHLTSAMEELDSLG
jgi:hypothetical protein